MSRLPLELLANPHLCRKCLDRKATIFNSTTGWNIRYGYCRDCYMICVKTRVRIPEGRTWRQCAGTK